MTSMQRFLGNDIIGSLGAQNSSAKYAFGYNFSNKTITSSLKADGNDPSRLLTIIGVSVFVFLFVGLILYFAIKCR